MPKKNDKSTANSFNLSLQLAHLKTSKAYLGGTELIVKRTFMNLYGVPPTMQMVRIAAFITSRVTQGAHGDPALSEPLAYFFMIFCCAYDIFWRKHTKTYLSFIEEILSCADYQTPAEKRAEIEKLEGEMELLKKDIDNSELFHQQAMRLAIMAGFVFCMFATFQPLLEVIFVGIIEQLYYATLGKYVGTRALEQKLKAQKESVELFLDNLLENTPSLKERRSSIFIESEKLDMLSQAFFVPITVEIQLGKENSRIFARALCEVLRLAGLITYYRPQGGIASLTIIGSIVDNNSQQANPQTLGEILDHNIVFLSSIKQHERTLISILIALYDLTGISWYREKIAGIDNKLRLVFCPTDILSEQNKKDIENRFDYLPSDILDVEALKDGGYRIICGDVEELCKNFSTIQSKTAAITAVSPQYLGMEQRPQYPLHPEHSQIVSTHRKCQTAGAGKKTAKTEKADFRAPFLMELPQDKGIFRSYKGHTLFFSEESIEKMRQYFDNPEGAQRAQETLKRGNFYGSQSQGQAGLKTAEIGKMLVVRVKLLGFFSNQRATFCTETPLPSKPKANNEMVPMRFLRITGH